MSDYQEVYLDRIDIKAALTGSTYTDPPLLQELGIDFSLIRNEAFLIFKPRVIEQCDITGPLLITFLYAIALLLNGKIHFGYVYFLTLVFNLLICFLLNVIKTSQKKIDLIMCFSILGYSFTPIVGFSFIYAMCGIIKYFGYLCALWSSYIGAIVFCKSLELEDNFYIVGYPILLFNLCFVVWIIM
ncbi:hypothetical protein GVAV_001323 [Gurleya vavrai]